MLRVEILEHLQLDWQQQQELVLVLLDSLEVAVIAVVVMVVMVVVVMMQPFRLNQVVEDPLHLSVENLLQDFGWLIRLVSDLVDIDGRLLFAVLQMNLFEQVDLFEYYLVLEVE